jgi:hypothetical protein
MLYISGKRVGEGRDGGVLGFSDYSPRGNGFNGKVKAVKLAIADAAENADHLVNLEDTIRVAMARQ